MAGKRRKLMIAVIAVIVVVITAVIVFAVTAYQQFPGKTMENPILYIKEGELHAKYGNKTFKLTENMYEDGIIGMTPEQSGLEASKYVKLTDDGKTLIYMDDLKLNGTYKMYSRDLASLDDDPLPIEVPEQTEQDSKAGIKEHSIVRDIEEGEHHRFEKTEERSVFNVYYNDGEKDILVVQDKMQTFYDYYYKNDRAVSVYAAVEDDGTYKWHLLVNDDVIPLDDIVVTENGITHIPGTLWIAEGGDALYYPGGINPTISADLYRVRIADGKPMKPELVDTEVMMSSSISRTLEDGTFIYFKNLDNHQTADMYTDGKLIAENVMTVISFDGYIVFPQSKNGSLYFYSDYEPGIGKKLNVYKNGTRTVIDENVSHYALLPYGGISYLKDYSYDTNTGTLYVYDGERSVKIADEVEAIVILK